LYMVVFFVDWIWLWEVEVKLVLSFRYVIISKIACSVKYIHCNECCWAGVQSVLMTWQNSSSGLPITHLMITTLQKWNLLDHFALMSIIGYHRTTEMLQQFTVKQERYRIYIWFFIIFSFTLFRKIDFAYCVWIMFPAKQSLVYFA
jgi:hypothetical protein